MDSVLIKILKVLKEELERICKDLELQSRGPHPTQTSSINTPSANTANMLSQPNVHATIKAPKLEITPFDGSVLK